MITKISNPITWEELTKILDYCPDTGIFTWKESRNSNTAIKGSIAGSYDKDGYIVIGISRKNYKAHRLAWFYCFKEWPEFNIDHINRDKQDNSLNNLRDIPQADNNRNVLVRSSSGFKCVSLHSSGKYQASVRINGKSKYLGLYNTPEEANIAVLDYKKLNNINIL